MNTPFPAHHSNPETFKDEPVYIFEDAAIYPVPKNGSPPASDTTEPKPPATPPSEGPPSGEAQQ